MRLLPVVLSVLVLSALPSTSLAGTAESSPRANAAARADLQLLAVRIYAVSRELDAARLSGRPPAAAVADTAVRARLLLQTMQRDLAAGAFGADSGLATKQRQVAELLHNLELAQQPGVTGPSGLIPPHLPRLQRAHEVVAPSHGGSCATALGIAPGHEVDAMLRGGGQAGSEVWLRIAPDAPGFYLLDTAAEALDTELTLFAGHCPSDESEAIARNDDAFGLAARLGVDAHKHRGPWFARLRNTGQAGLAAVTLGAGGQILGTVVDQRNNTPLAANVTVLTSGGGTVVSGATSGDGSYALAVPAGTYYVRADAGGFVGELYPDAPCGSAYAWDLSACATAQAQTVTVADGGVAGNIDFALNVGGRIAGVVRDRSSDAPLPGASLILYDQNGNPVNTANPAPTDSAGRYIVSGLLTGTYYLAVSASGHGSELWRRIDCDGAVQQTCTPSKGTALNVVRNQLLQDVDFDLPMEAAISATFNPGATRGNYWYWTLDIYDTSGALVQSTNSNVNSTTILSGPLAPGSYFAAAYTNGYFGQLWKILDCPQDCTTQFSLATPIALATQGSIANISFSPRPYPSMSGQVTDAITHAPVVDAEVYLFAAGSGTYEQQIGVDPNGNYQFAAVSPGSYYVLASSPTHTGIVYPNAPCRVQGSLQSCGPNGATPVTVSYAGGNVSGIDIAMQPGGYISGHVNYRAPGDLVAPVAGANVVVADSNGVQLGQTSTDAQGGYTVANLPAGSLHAEVSGPAIFTQIYQGIDCTPALACDLTRGTPVVLGEGQNASGINFTPFATGTLFGRVTYAGTGIGGVAIDAWNTTTTDHCGAAVTDAAGYYAVSSGSGSWNCSSTAQRLSTDAGSTYIDQVFDGIACSAGPAYLGLCSIANGTQVAFPQSPQIVTANFALQPKSDTIFANGFEATP